MAHPILTPPCCSRIRGRPGFRPSLPKLEAALHQTLFTWLTCEPASKSCMCWQGDLESLDPETACRARRVLVGPKEAKASMIAAEMGKDKSAVPAIKPTPPCHLLPSPASRPPPSLLPCPPPRAAPWIGHHSPLCGLAACPMSAPSHLVRHQSCVALCALHQRFLVVWRMAMASQMVLTRKGVGFLLVVLQPGERTKAVVQGEGDVSELPKCIP